MENIITPGLALKAAVPGDDRRGGALTTNNTVSETNKFGVDAVELNPNIEGSMAHDIVELNSSLTNRTTWKFHSQETGSIEQNLPSEYEELLLVIGGFADNIRYTTIVIPRLFLNSETVQFTGGTPYKSGSHFNGYAYLINANCNNITLHMVLQQFSGTDTISQSTLAIYYR